MLNIYKLKKKTLYNNTSNKLGIYTNEIKTKVFTKEWFNTVYFYNKNNEKSIPSLDITVYNTIKIYFNMFSRRLERSIRMRKRAIWKRRLKLNRILIAKPEFKHTNDKVIITLYVYNRQLSILKRKLNKVKRLFYTQFFFRILAKNILMVKKFNVMKALLDKFYPLKKKIIKFKNSIEFYAKLKSSGVRFSRKKRSRYIRLIRKYRRTLKKLLILRLKINKARRIFNLGKKRMRLIKSVRRILNKINPIVKNIQNVKSIKRMSNKINLFRKRKNFVNRSKKLMTSMFVYLNINKKLVQLFDKLAINTKFKVNNLTYIRHFKRFLWRMKLYIRNNRMIKFNQFKFNLFLKPVKTYLEKIYKKNVEFNIVCLKNYKLDSSLLTQVIAIKLRNRKNRLLRVMRRVLSRVKIPYTRRLDYCNEISRKRYIQNVILRKYVNKPYYYLEPEININSYYEHLKTKRGDVYLNNLNLFLLNNDKLDNVLNSIYPTEYSMKLNNTEYLRRNIKNTVLDKISNKIITGIRIEGAGRLTRRISADRAVFKMKQIGTIRNINSSYNKIPSVLLRGQLNSNLQFSKANKKTRIGSYGIKGWISSI